jgi:small subunit ribosomal protein S8
MQKMMTDPIADMLTRIRNGLMSRKTAVEMPSSKIKEGIAQVLKEEGFISDWKVARQGTHKLLKIYLKYGPLGEDIIRSLERVSKPGRRVYSPVTELPFVANGVGIAIVSTNRGIMSDRACRKQKLGGEVLCTVF